MSTSLHSKLQVWVFVKIPWVLIQVLITLFKQHIALSLQVLLYILSLPCHHVICHHNLQTLSLSQKLSHSPTISIFFCYNLYIFFLSWIQAGNFYGCQMVMTHIYTHYYLWLMIVMWSESHVCFIVGWHIHLYFSWCGLFAVPPCHLAACGKVICQVRISK